MARCALARVPADQAAIRTQAVPVRALCRRLLRDPHPVRIVEHLFDRNENAPDP
jgi:hypothetical protein